MQPHRSGLLQLTQPQGSGHLAPLLLLLLVVLLLLLLVTLMCLLLPGRSAVMRVCLHCLWGLR
jgi:hypothetical protein